MYTSWSRVFFDAIPERSRVLDCGCGTGALGSKLKSEKDCYTVGVEVDENQARLAREGYDRLIVGDLEILRRLPFPEGFFNVIVFSDVLEHLEDPTSILVKLRSYLSDSGFVLISLPNIANWHVRLKLLLGKFDYTEYGILDETHLRFFTYKSARSMLLEAGYRIQREGVSWFDTRLVDRVIRRLRLPWLWRSLFSSQIVFQATKAGRLWGAVYRLPRENGEKYAGQAITPLDPKIKVVDQVSPGSKVLDLGCGAGILSEKLRKEKRCYVVGVEREPSLIEVAKPKCDMVILADLMNCTSLPLEEQSFDYVTLIDVLEHLSDPSRAVELARKYVNPKSGTVVVSVPNVANWVVRLKLLVGRFSYEGCGILDRCHMRFFTKRTLLSFLRKRGLAPTRIVYTDSRPFTHGTSGIWPTLLATQFVVEAELEAKE
jgi:methionine biosynthesis protein MetW